MKNNLHELLIDRIGDAVLGRYKGGTFEQKLVLVGSLFVAIVSLVGSMANFALNLTSSGLVAAIFSLLSLICFSLVRFGFLSKWLITCVFFVSIVFCNLLWYFSFGSQGSALYLIIGAYVFFILIAKEEHYIVLVVICFVNVLALFLLELLSPDIVGRYPDEPTRIADVYSGGLFALILVLGLTISVKRNYLRQYERAKKSDQLKSAFLANLSHEVRTPLNVISGFTSMIPEMNYSDDDLKAINRIIDLNGMKLLSLIEDIIDLSKLEVEELELHYSMQDLRKLLEDQRQEFCRYLDADALSNIKLECRVEVEKKQQFIDPFRVKQVVRLLLSNAYRFTEHGTILVGCYENDEHLIFYVKDSGSGIKTENYSAIFDPFIKIQNRDNTLEGGVGIGLHLAKRLVEKMSGKIWFESQYRVGSEFYFSIPKRKT
ncbi:sensor histidine kinase [Mangrovibacterium sp.]|uniref:sensor histidine kinase n=1 Tax=Mangrovibacterium sp. TaxID=1961364 RepID=UPI0035681806